jgi:hypothetical protein
MIAGSSSASIFTGAMRLAAASALTEYAAVFLKKSLLPDSTVEVLEVSLVLVI